MAPKRKKEEAPSDSDGDTKKKASAGSSKAKVNPKRWRKLKEGEVGQGPVIYWMSRDQRVHDNWALIHACEQAAKHKAPVAVAFNLVTEYMGAGARQFGFMLRGLKLLEPELAKLGIPFFLLKGRPEDTIPKLVKDSKAALLVADQSPMKLARSWRTKVAEKLEVPMHEVDAHNIVPVWEASDKRETGARTIRPKIHKKLPEFLQEIPQLDKPAKWEGSPKPSDNKWDATIKEAVERGREVPEIDWATPGEAQASKAMDAFLTKERIGIFAKQRNDPNEPKALSGLSCYIHFGQLGMQRAALRCIEVKSKYREGVDGFLEEAVVRRELSDNFCFYEQNHDSLECLANWAKETHNKHRSDEREYTYTWDQFEKGETHDDLWNAAQKQMTQHGKMHGFLRMYWAKKILEWTVDPEQALDFAQRLNDKWEIDGRDPNGVVGVLWSIGGIHDQGWGERDVFGKIRCMTYSGCKRKFDIRAFIESVKNGTSHAAVPR